ncbi:hypothetical protein NQ314_020531 [Rhamnusium bicolor]|uniref:Large ribosomal subunit protein mL53 n=1 Tax=Rhamnusium bicolor TaxID=1586634 RepID=A0AAV8WKB3_9CUCU|nr:hypothetical protein NQ314_020531 [Rhamnusium bicolor]
MDHRITNTLFCVHGLVHEHNLYVLNITNNTTYVLSAKLSKMSIYYSGTFTRSAGVISAIVKQLKLVNLKPVKKIQIQFDPFHPNAATARNFLFHISSPKVAETNLNCAIKTNIVCDRSEPEIRIDLLDSGSIKFLTNNLTVLEILQHINKHISSKVKDDPIDQEALSKIATKNTKKTKKTLKW